MKKLLILGLLISLVQTASGAEDTPAFVQPEVLKAALAINLTDEQKPQFQQALTDFVNDQDDAIRLLMRRNNQTNLPRKIKGKRNGLLKAMDKQMATFLTQEQMPAYEHYAKTLKSYMRGM